MSFISGGLVALKKKIKKGLMENSYTFTMYTWGLGWLFISFTSTTVILVGRGIVSFGKVHMSCPPSIRVSEVVT